MRSILIRLILQPMGFNFTSTRQHTMDELILGEWSFDRSIRQALQIAVPCFAHARDGDELPSPTDVPVPEPFDVPVPTPTDVPPPEPRDVPPPKMPNPGSDPPPKPRPIP